MRMLKTMVAALALVGALAAGSPSTEAGNQLAVAVSGYDPVTFHEGTPKPGIPRLNASWNGGVWYFTTEANRDKFRANPAVFAPQFDGYCAWAASQGYKAPGNPEYWRVVNGKLYLQVTEQAQGNWLKDVPGNVSKAEVNWPRIHPF